ncbi:MAG TPA: GNAT family N-acetyltransferase [Gammaproteobacteria bacterium]|nr:GNAT family N-acetyltransferase [Gammaproteobacteria bacterium]
MHTSITEIPAKVWNALAGTAAPCLRHEYFAALEASRSVGPGSGWIANYFTLADRRGKILGAVPLFEKRDSSGEFVFDWNWAAALERIGRNYYPKLVAAIPFTPVPGPRLLLARPGDAALAAGLARAVQSFAAERGVSSLHWLFVAEEELPAFEAGHCLIRSGCHFLWSNPGVANFEEWLATLTAARRKVIRRERRRIAEAGIRCEWRRGAELNAEELALIYRLYAANYYAHGMPPYLTPAFFVEFAQRLPDALIVCLARRGAETVAGAICLRDEERLYGRYWGAFEWVDSLHFEVCYYQGIEYALAQGLRYFHPGVQGEHKLFRGFAPTLHYSAHWLRDGDLRAAVAHFLDRERAAVGSYAAQAGEFLPFRHDKG